MFVRRLVTGVRSSCEASATSWRCACTDASSAFIERSSASSIALKLLARRPSSSSPTDLMRPLRSCVSATCSVAWLRRLSGSTAAPATSSPEQRRQRDSAEVQQREDQAQAAEQAVDFGQRLGELHGAAFAERLGQHAQVEPLTCASRKNGRAAVLGQLERVRRSTGSDTLRAERATIVPAALTTCW